MNIPTINAGKLSAVLTVLADVEPRVDSDGPTHHYIFGRQGPKLHLAVKRPPIGSERLTLAALVLDVDVRSRELAEMLGLPHPDARTRFEFCDLEGERLDVYAPRVLDIEDAATIMNFIGLPLAA